MQQERCHKVLQQIAWTDELVWHKICSLFYFSATLSGNTLNQPIKHRKKHIQYQALYRAVSCSAHRGHKQKNIFDSVNFLKTKKSCSKSAKTCLISWTLLEIIWWNVHQAKSSHLSTSWEFEFRDVSVSPSVCLSVQDKYGPILPWNLIFIFMVLTMKLRMKPTVFLTLWTLPPLWGTNIKI